MIQNSHLLNFTQLSQEELKMILMWRNSKNIQKWMLNTENISLMSHLKFVKSLHNTHEKLYFLVKNDTSYIGVINFTDITSSSCAFGIYKNPTCKAAGDTLLSLICNYAFEKLKVISLKAKVFSENTKALELYKRHNFRELQRENYKERELINMELKR